ncbi:MAG: type I DNA topoisomerase [Acidobacteria bacterium]|nr:type I DNA topoisomerase [Acidobacteriota bacterium]
MAKNLVIVESPAKARTINKFLGKDFKVLASMGHVRDLPEKKFGVDVNRRFEPEYVLVKGRKKNVDELKEAARDAETVYLAPDPDREGEAIAWHLKELLSKAAGDNRFRRVVYHEITAQAIQRAFENPGEIDLRKVDAQQARRVLDRLVGYQVSPLLWRRVPGAASAGRVQSVALRLVCEREAEIEAFVPEEYWILGARVRKQAEPRDPFDLRLAKIDGEKAEIKDRVQAEKIQAELERRRLQVISIKRREISKRARPPYITSTLQQAASTVHGYSPSRTMKIAQRLYEGINLGDGAVGLITYMRTDSTSISQQAQQECRTFIGDRYGRDYVPAKPNVYKSRSGAQEAHEAIRPTDVRNTPERMEKYLSPEEKNLYRLIWQRFVASQMAPAVIAQRTVEVEAADSGDTESAYLFRASASEVIFAGYMKVSGLEKKSKEDGQNGNGDDDVDSLPPLAEGEALDLLEWLADQKYTQPPPRYSEASLVRTMEENGVGRPSTYAQVLATLFQREYVLKEKKALKPTDLGKRVNDFLAGNLNHLFEVAFTARMENSLDEVEAGHTEWHEMLEEFYRRFTTWLEEARGPKADRREIEILIRLLDQVIAWAPPEKRGQRVYSDEKFFASIKKQAEAGDKALTQRQADALKKLALRYRDQVPGLAEVAEELGLEEVAEEQAANGMPRPETMAKLDLLAEVTFRQPYQVGKRTFDDKAFYLSLKQQAEGGKALSDNQVNYLNRLVCKYADQIENFDEVAAELGLGPESAEGEDKVSGPLLDALARVKEWKEPVQKGKKVWDDHKFYDSLRQQFRQKHALSPRQQQALKRLVKRYAKQIPDYDRVKKECAL